MSRLVRVATAVVLVVVLCGAVTLARPRARPTPPRALSTAPRMDLTGIVEPIARASAWYAAARVELERSWYAAARARAAARVQRATPNARRSYSGGAAGFPGECIINHESRNAGTYTTANGDGAYQIIPSTWGGYGGYTNASDAPPSVQDERARQLWANGAGGRHWNGTGCPGTG